MTSLKLKEITAQILRSENILDYEELKDKNGFKIKYHILDKKNSKDDINTIILINHEKKFTLGISCEVQDRGIVIRETSDPNLILRIIKLLLL